jgi:hypothetical protein
VGELLLDSFKQQQDEHNTKHKKEKRNSTKKELHEDGEEGLGLLAAVARSAALVSSRRCLLCSTNNVNIGVPAFRGYGFDVKRVLHKGQPECTAILNVSLRLLNLVFPVNLQPNA